MLYTIVLSFMSFVLLYSIKKGFNCYNYRSCPLFSGTVQKGECGAMLRPEQLFLGQLVGLKRVVVLHDGG